ncbi:hypothetical protein [Candidatus Bartonella washoeensis]|uniref:hypothetical protein n=1 Tax=Candidatus Bartonella washoeensis TaxID=186739 RepID=UPI0011BD1014|nr:hypothetical protein [Bartonella washoeensis]
MECSDFTVKSVTEDGTTEDKNYPDVASAFSGVGSSFTHVQRSLTHVQNALSEEISAARSDSLNWSDKDHAFIATHGKLGVNSKITHLRMEPFLKDLRML